MVITVEELNKTIKQRRTFSFGSFQVLNTGNSIKTGYIHIYNKDGEIFLSFFQNVVFFFLFNRFNYFFLYLYVNTCFFFSFGFSTFFFCFSSHQRVDFYFFLFVLIFCFTFSNTWFCIYLFLFFRFFHSFLFFLFIPFSTRGVLPVFTFGSSTFSSSYLFFNVLFVLYFWAIRLSIYFSFFIISSILSPFLR